MLLQKASVIPRSECDAASLVWSHHVGQDKPRVTSGAIICPATTGLKVISLSRDGRGYTCGGSRGRTTKGSTVCSMASYLTMDVEYNQNKKK